MIDHVTKATRGAEPHLIFASMNAAVPLNRRVAVLGRQGSGKSTLLALLAGSEPVDGGRIHAAAKFSMLLNSKGFLYPSMNGIENTEFLARIFALPPKRLVELAVSLPGITTDIWLQPVGDLLPRARRGIEVLLAALLPFDCYLLDDIERVDANIVTTLIRLTAPRNAGLIFTTFAPKAARQFGQAGAVIANRGVQVFETVKEAETFYG